MNTNLIVSRRSRLVAGGVLIALCTWMVVAAALPDRAADPDQPARDARIAYSDELLIQLAVADLDRAMRFYGSTLELKLVKHDPNLEWAKFDTNVPGVRIGVGRQDVVSGSGTISINIGVQDVDAARMLLESRGVEFPRPSINIPGDVKLAAFSDPDGNRLRLAGPPDPVQRD